jgi:hypothetical protein
MRLNRTSAIILALAALALGAKFSDVIDSLIARLDPRPAPAFAASILNPTTDTLELVTSSTSTINYTLSYIEYTATTSTPASTQGSISTATTTVILSAPAASTQRQVKRLSVRNIGTVPNIVLLQKDVSGANFEMYQVSLGPDQTFILDSEGEVTLYGLDGVAVVPSTRQIDGTTLSFLKNGATSEAAGVRNYLSGNTGFPGAWQPGTPGINGIDTNCAVVGTAGSGGALGMGAPFLPNPALGGYYVSAASFAANAPHAFEFSDIVWYNTDIVVTTTTAQLITMPTLPNRSLDGTNLGEGWNAAIFVRVATTNAAAVTNTTLDYTDSDGNPTNTATIPSFPATAIAGTFVPFALAGGDRGIRSIQSITLGTSYGGGSISLVLYRQLGQVVVPAANLGGSILPLNFSPTGPRLWNGSCLWLGYIASATTATTVGGSIWLSVK